MYKSYNSVVASVPQQSGHADSSRGGL